MYSKWSRVEMMRRWGMRIEIQNKNLQEIVNIFVYILFQYVEFGFTNVRSSSFTYNNKYCHIWTDGSQFNILSFSLYCCVLLSIHTIFGFVLSCPVLSPCPSLIVRVLEKKLNKVQKFGDWIDSKWHYILLFWCWSRSIFHTFGACVCLKGSDR